MAPVVAFFGCQNLEINLEAKHQAKRLTAAPGHHRAEAVLRKAQGAGSPYLEACLGQFRQRIITIGPVQSGAALQLEDLDLADSPEM